MDDYPIVGAALPTQTGNTGKFLTTNGTVASWATPGGGISGFGNTILVDAVNPYIYPRYIQLNIGNSDPLFPVTCKIVGDR